MIFQKLSSAALLAALAMGVAAEPVKFTKRSNGPFGHIRIRQVDTAYQPETTECGEGNTCAEACGAGYLQCASTDEANHCYNPEAGETCCEFPGNGNSCEAGYFCAHTEEKNTVCCAEGKSVDECASINEIAAGGLTSDPPVPTTTSSSSTSSSTEASTTTTSSSSSSSSESTTSASSTYAQPSNGTDSLPTKATTTPEPTIGVVEEGAAARFGSAGTAAVLVAAGAFAALF